MECLESRRLMAVTAQVNTWTLIVEGDSNNNWISIEQSAGFLWVMDYSNGNNSVVLHVDPAAIQDIEVYGNAGNDLITVANNIDADATLFGSAGADYLRGGGGTYSTLVGHGWGSDEDSDDGAADTLISGSGESDLWGQNGNDHLYTDNYAVSGLDFMFGGNGSDTFYIRGQDHNAYAVGEAGHDTLVPYQNATQHVNFEGGSGNDRVNYRAWTAAIYVRPNGLNDSGLRNGARRQLIGADVEIIEGTDHADHFSSTNSANTFYGYGGNDLMYGYGGNDYLVGGDGSDTIYAGSGNDVVSGGYGNDFLFGDSGNDTVDGSFGSDDVHGGDGNDLLYGGEGADWIYGDAGNDVLVGGAGSDYLHAHDGAFGNDSVWGDNINGTGGGGALDVAYIDRFYFNGSFIGDAISGIESASF